MMKKNLIYVKQIFEDNAVFEEWFEYEYGKIISTKDSDDIVCLYEYNDEEILVQKTKIYNECNEEIKHYYYLNDNLVHIKTITYDKRYYENEIFYKYDSKNRKIFEKNSLGEVIKEWKWDDYGHLLYKKEIEKNVRNYNESGNLLLTPDISVSTFVYKNEYNQKGNLIYSLYQVNNETNYVYKWDDKCNLIYYESYISEKVYEYEYNSENKLVHILEKSKNGIVYEERIEYENGVKVHINCSDGKEYKYDSNGKLTYRRDSDGNEYKYNYRGELFYHKNNYGDVFWYEVDSNKNPIHFKNYEIEEWYEYEFYDNGNIKKKICYRAI